MLRPSWHHDNASIYSECTIEDKGFQMKKNRRAKGQTAKFHIFPLENLDNEVSPE